LIRNIFLLILVFIGLFLFAAIAAYWYWGWVGLLSVIGGFAAFIWIVKRFALRLVFWMISRPIRKQGKALKGAAVDVHRISPGDEPEPAMDGMAMMREVLQSMQRPQVNEWEDDEALEDDRHDADDEDESYEDDQEKFGEEDFGEEDFGEEDFGAEDPLHYYQGPRNFHYVDLTVSPRKRDLGKRAEEIHWKPTALTLTSPAEANSDTVQRSPLAELSGQAFDGSCELYGLKIWKQGEFIELGDDDFELHGPQRLQLHIGVKPEIEVVNVMYFFEPIGHIQLGTVIDI